jgi:alpha-1,2-mannosyltransferase
VHYPTISDDMVQSVSSGVVAPNNSRGGRSLFKLAYYHFICRPMYFFGGQFVNLAMVNSKWTKSHVEKRWGGMAALVYPPVDVDKFSPAPPPPPIDDGDSETTALSERQQPARDIAIMSCAQFRPEKDHALQIEILRRVHQKMLDQGKEERELPCMMVAGGAVAAHAVSAPF